MDMYTIVQPFGNWALGGLAAQWDQLEVDPAELSPNELTEPNWVDVPELYKDPNQNQNIMLDGQIATVKLRRAVEIHIGDSVFYHPINAHVRLFHVPGVVRRAHLLDDPIPGQIPIVGGKRLKRKQTKKSKKYSKRRRSNRSNRR